MEPIKELNFEELEKVSGGNWNYGTLTSEEQAEYDAIGQMFLNARGSKEMTLEAAHAWQDFEARMDAKYND